MLKSPYSVAAKVNICYAAVLLSIFDIIYPNNQLVFVHNSFDFYKEISEELI